MLSAPATEVEDRVADRAVATNAGAAEAAAGATAATPAATEVADGATAATPAATEVAAGATAATPAATEATAWATAATPAATQATAGATAATPAAIEEAARGPERVALGSVAIVGASGSLGFGLAVRLGRAGTSVLIGSRDGARAARAAERARAAAPEGRFEGRENDGAVRDAETVILSVPFGSQPEILHALRGALQPGQLLIDATVPLAIAADGACARTLGVWQGSAAQQARELLPAGVRLVSALHTVSAGSLADPEHPLEQDVLLCGDSRADKRQAARLIERIDGLRCVDCGALEMARVTESLTALLIAVKAAHKIHPGVRLTGLPDGLWD